MHPEYPVLALVDARDLLFASIACGVLAAAVRFIERKKKGKDRSYAFQLLGLAAGVFMIAALVLGWVEVRGPMH